MKMAWCFSPHKSDDGSSGGDGVSTSTPVYTEPDPGNDRSASSQSASTAGSGVCAAFIDGQGVLQILTAHTLQNWAAPFGLGAPVSAPHGGISMAFQPGGNLDCLYVAADGRMTVAWGADQLWHPGASFGSPFAPAGAGTAVSKQAANQLTAAAIGNDGSSGSPG